MSGMRTGDRRQVNELRRSLRDEVLRRGEGLQEEGDETEAVGKRERKTYEKRKPEQHRVHTKNKQGAS